MPKVVDKYRGIFDSDEMVKDFIDHCNECNRGCPMGCITRREHSTILDPNCSSILKCFARFLLSKEPEVKDED